MRVLQVVHKYPPARGGVENHVYNLSRSLSNLGCEVTVLTTRNGPNEKRLDYERGIRVIRVPSLTIKGVVVAPSMLNYIQKADADIIHTHGIISSGTILSCLSRKPNIVMTPHFHPPSTHRYPFPNILLNKLFVPLEKKGIKKVVALTALEKTILCKEFAYFDENSIEVIPNGIDLERFNGIDHNAWQEKGGDYILFVGRLAHNKGLDTLIKAFDKVHTELEIELMVVGQDAGFEKEIRMLIDKMGLKEHVHLLGGVDDSELISLYKGAKATILPAKYEAFGLSLIESLALGTPVIISDRMAIKELLLDKGCCLVTKYGDPDNLAELIKVIISDDKIRGRLSQKGRTLAKEMSWRQIAEKIHGVYQDMLMER